MRICIDLDGVIAGFKKSGQTYADVDPIEGAIGIGMQTLDWLDRHEVCYDEIFFGKPWANIYIDDNALRFTDWDSIDNKGENLPISNETKNKLNK